MVFSFFNYFLTIITQPENAWHSDQVINILTPTVGAARASQLYSELQQRNATISATSLAACSTEFLELAETTAELEALVGLPGTPFFYWKW